MTFDGIRRLSPYWSLALCYGVVTAVGLIPGLLYGNEFAYWLLGFWLILPVSALLCTFLAGRLNAGRTGAQICILVSKQIETLLRTLLRCGL